MIFHEKFNGIIGILKYIFKKIVKKPKNRRFASALPDYPISPLWAKYLQKINMCGDFYS